MQKEKDQDTMSITYHDICTHCMFAETLALYKPQLRPSVSDEETVLWTLFCRFSVAGGLISRGW